MDQGDQPSSGSCSTTSMTYNQKIDQFRDVFAKDISKSIIEYKPELLRPLILTKCNGDDSVVFSDATLNYRKKPGFPAFMWYQSGYLELAHELQGKNVFPERRRPVVEFLLDSVISDKHMKCLKSLWRATEKLDELKVKKLLALHYFQPLIVGSCYTNDKGAKCDSCNKKLVYGDTSFGNRNVWHGIADIVLQKSVVKVDTEETENEEDEDSLGDGEPEVKQRKKDKLEKTRNKRAKSQALAQGIVNAFCEAKKDKSLFKKFTPSFLATEKNIRVILYNPGSDILLLSQKFRIFEKKPEQSEPTLNLKTLVQVWLCLNFEKFEMNIPDYVRDRAPKSQFTKVVGEENYLIYLKNISRPLEQKDPIKELETEEGLDYEAVNKMWTDRNALYIEIKNCQK